MIVQSWVAPKVKKGGDSAIAGKGLFAIADIAKDEIVAVKAGHIIDGKTLYRRADIIKGSELQIADDLFVAPLEADELEASMLYINHSCEPNLGMAGNVIFSAIRRIRSGEELTLDYAMFKTSTTQEFSCNCQTDSCRKVVRNSDWQIPELQKKYAGYFSWYLQRKTKEL